MKFTEFAKEKWQRGMAPNVEVEKKIPWLKVLIRFLIMVFAFLLLECTVFNYKAFMGKGEVRTLSIDDAYLSSLVKDGDYYKATASKPYIEFRGLDVEVKSYSADISYKDDSRYEVTLTISYSTEEKPNIIRSLDKKLSVIPEMEYTRYDLVSSHIGPLYRLRINIANCSSGNILKIGKITINEGVPFHFSWVRMGFCLSLGTLAFALIHMIIYRKRFEMRDLPLLGGKVLLVCLSLGMVIFVFWLYGYGENPFLRSSGGTQVSQQLVDAFLKGHLYLDATPSDTLLSMANPYDPTARSLAGIPDLYEDYWDHLLYDGKFYSYYGTGPVFLFFLPMHLITGQYVNDAYGVLIFTLIGTVAGFLAYDRVMKGAFKNKRMPMYIYVGGYLLFFLAGGALNNLMRPSFYEVSTSSAYMAMMLGLCFLAYAKMFDADKPKTRLVPLGIASFFFGFAVICRATMALYCVGFVVLVLFRFFEREKEFELRRKIVYFVVAGVPLAFFAIYTCWYNYARFGSIFDFGIEYSLTIADFKNMEFRPLNVIVSLYNFLFGIATPTLDNPPGLTTIPANFGTDYYFFETSKVYGLFARIPALFLVFVLPFTRRKEAKVERYKDVAKYFIPCVIMPFIQVIITWQSGYATRYFSDFSWPLIIYLAYLVGDYANEHEGKPFAESTLPLLTFVSVFFGVISTMQFNFLYIPQVTKHEQVTVRYYEYFYYAAWRDLLFWR